MKIIDFYNISFSLLIAIFVALLSIFSGAVISFFRYSEYKNILLEIVSFTLLILLILFSLIVLPVYATIIIIILTIVCLFIGYITVYKKREI